MIDAPNTRERRVLDILSRGDALPISEFHNVGESTLASMAAKGWVNHFPRQPGGRIVYEITDAGREARDIKPAQKPRNTPRLKTLADRIPPAPPRIR